jgi:hypothetical protein
MKFTESFDTSEVPTNWKDANMTPIFKKGAKGDSRNYRPVSLTAVSCKVMESIIRDDMMCHLLNNELINPSQHGFMPGRSCCTNLLEFLEKVTSVEDGGHPIDVVFLDFAKAFDKVPRERLLEKLYAHGIRGKALAWIRAMSPTKWQKLELGRHAVRSPTGECPGLDTLPGLHQ